MTDFVVLVPPDLISLTLRHARRLSPRVLHLTLARSDGLPQAFLPGQFFRAQIPSPAGPQWRSYSIANATLPGRTDHTQIEWVVTLLEGGLGGRHLSQLKEGERILVSGPNGRFCLLPEDSPRRLFLLGTGTGVAPYRAMLPGLLALADRGVQVILGLGARSPIEQLFASEFRDADASHPNLQLRLFHSRAMPAAPDERDRQGRVLQLFDEFDPVSDGDIVYLCGHPEMVDAGFVHAKAAGLHPRFIRREKYQTVIAPTSAPASG
jgi:ferredoxin-NADP reductase